MLTEEGFDPDTEVGLHDPERFEAERRKYYSRVLQQTSTREGRKTYFREDYLGDGKSAVYAEYLDWLDELSYDSAEGWVEESLPSFTYYLALQFTKFNCEGHSHRLVPIVKDHNLDKLLAQDIPIRPDAPLPRTSCWGRTIRRAVTRSSSKRRQCAVLPSVNTDMMSSFNDYGYVSVGRDEKESNTSETTSGEEGEHKGKRLPPITFQTFRNAWYGETRLRDALNKVAALTDVEVRLKEFNIPAAIDPVADRPVYPVTCRHSSGQVAETHGLHSLLTYHPNPGIVFALLNRHRMQCGVEKRITVKTLTDAMQICPHCNRDRPPTMLSPFGLYYAPPGTGKSTALELEHIVALDTDWLAEFTPTTFHETIAPFVYHNVPIVTNQHGLATNAAIKMVGVYSSRHRRIDPMTNKPYASRSSIVHSERMQRPNFACMFDSTDAFFDDHLITLFYMNYLSHYSQYRYFGRASVHRTYGQVEMPQRRTLAELEAEIRRYPLPDYDKIQVMPHAADFDAYAAAASSENCSNDGLTK